MSSERALVDGSTSRPRRILVADDSDGVRTLFHRLLSADGHEVLLAPDGAAALEAGASAFVTKSEAFDELVDTILQHCRRS